MPTRFVHRLGVSLQNNHIDCLIPSGRAVLDLTCKLETHKMVCLLTVSEKSDTKSAATMGERESRSSIVVLMRHPALSSLTVNNRRTWQSPFKQLLVGGHCDKFSQATLRRTTHWLAIEKHGV